MVIWITGVPGAGKTTIAKLLLEELRQRSIQSILIDGDSIRDVLQDFKYDDKSRQSLAYLYSRMSKMFSEQGSVVICATVSMYDVVRKWNTENITDYFEIYLSVSNEVLKVRNQKGLYRDNGAIEGEPAPLRLNTFEVPKFPNLTLDSSSNNLPVTLVKQILKEINIL